MKRFIGNILAALVISATVALAACTTAPPAPGAVVDPAQAAITSTTNAYVGLDAAIKAADAALQAGALKGKDAQNAFTAFQVSKRGLDAALASLRAAAAAPGTPASGAKP